MKYLANDWSIEMPDAGFEDHTNHVFETKVRDGDTAGFVVMRAALPAGQTLREAVQARILDEAKRFAGYSVIGERDTTLPCGLVLEVRARWRHDARTVYQRQAHLMHGATWMILSMRTPFQDSATCDAWMDRMLATLTLNG